MLQIPFMALTWHKGTLTRANTKTATRAVLGGHRGRCFVLELSLKTENPFLMFQKRCFLWNFEL